MKRKIKNFISKLLLIIFLFPLIVKLEHYHEHEHFICKAKNENHFHESDEKCAICDFEFSIFSIDYEEVDFYKEKPLESYCNNYTSQYYSNLTEYSFLLRAPPCLQI